MKSNVIFRAVAKADREKETKYKSAKNLYQNCYVSEFLCRVFVTDFISYLRFIVVRISFIWCFIIVIGSFLLLLPLLMLLCSFVMLFCVLHLLDMKNVMPDTEPIL